MGIPIEKTFTVAADAGAVWEFLTDPRRVAKCLPGAAVGEQIDERTYKGTMSLKVGPVAAKYRGKVTFERLDAEAREADLAASAQETGGRGGASMKMKSKIEEIEPGSTRVTVSSEVDVVGILAQFGRGMIVDVSDELFEVFTKAMREDLESAPADPNAETARLVAAAAPEPEPPAPAPAAPEAETPGATAPAAPPKPAEPEAASPADEREPEAFQVGAFGARVAKRTLARWARSPGFWILLAALLLLIYWLALR